MGASFNGLHLAGTKRGSESSFAAGYWMISKRIETPPKP
jgi:hypothetical protein